MSTWEIAIKSAMGRIEADVEEIIAATAATGFVELPIRMSHTARARDLPPLHRDPFDRILASQALVEGLTIVTRDAIFDEYHVPTLWG